MTQGRFLFVDIVGQWLMLQWLADRPTQIVCATSGWPTSSAVIGTFGVMCAIVDHLSIFACVILGSSIGGAPYVVSAGDLIVFISRNKLCKTASLLLTLAWWSQPAALIHGPGSQQHSDVVTDKQYASESNEIANIFASTKIAKIVGIDKGKMEAWGCIAATIIWNCLCHVGRNRGHGAWPWTVRIQPCSWCH